MVIRTCVLLCILALSSGSLRAEGIPVEPGLWEMTSTMKMPMLPQPRTTTVTECLKSSEISMDQFGGAEMDPDCRFETTQVDGNTLQWTVDCPVEGGTSRGQWEATSAGDTVTGHIPHADSDSVLIVF